jgi:hypothetical protein
MGKSPSEERIEHERARRAVFGWLGGALLHETNNVLTVMAGVRQLAKAGVPMSDRIGGMIDQQLLRMEDLVGWIRRLAPDDSEGGAAASTASAVLETVEQIAQLAWKGRGIRIERRVGASVPPPVDAEAAALALLCLLLSVQPSRSGSSVLVRLSAEAVGPGVSFLVSVAPPPTIRADDPDQARASALLSATGGVLAGVVDATTASWRVEFGALAARG